MMLRHRCTNPSRAVKPPAPSRRVAQDIAMPEPIVNPLKQPRRPAGEKNGSWRKNGAHMTVDTHSDPVFDPFTGRQRFFQRPVWTENGNRL